MAAIWGYDEGINPLLQVDNNGVVTNRYLWSDRVDELLADEQKPTGSVAFNTVWALADHQGSIKDLLDFNPTTGASAVVDNRQYDAFGNLESQSGVVDVIFGYTGKFLDSFTGLQNNWNRWYSPKLGRFVSQDPIGFAGGDANLYRYAGNEPTNYIDPTGWVERPTGQPTQVYAIGESVDGQWQEHYSIRPPGGYDNASPSGVMRAQTAQERQYHVAYLRRLELIGELSGGMPRSIRNELDWHWAMYPAEYEDYAAEQRFKAGVEAIQNLAGAAVATANGKVTITPPPVATKSYSATLNPGAGTSTKSSMAPVKPLSGSAYNAENFTEVLSQWSRKNGYAHPDLPAYNGTTSGVLYPTNPVGPPIPLTSTPRQGSRFPYSQADGHVETNAARHMNNNGIVEGTVYHNNPKGTCGNCDKYTPTYLNPGSVLRVIPPPNAVAPKPSWKATPTIYRGNNNNPG